MDNNTRAQGKQINATPAWGSPSGSSAPRDCTTRHYMYAARYPRGTAVRVLGLANAYSGEIGTQGGQLRPLDRPMPRDAGARHNGR